MADNKEVRGADNACAIVCCGDVRHQCPRTGRDRIVTSNSPGQFINRHVDKSSPNVDNSGERSTRVIIEEYVKTGTRGTRKDQSDRPAGVTARAESGDGVVIVALPHGVAPRARRRAVVWSRLGHRSVSPGGVADRSPTIAFVASPHDDR
jgi:hypothetical protein